MLLNSSNRVSFKKSVLLGRVLPAGVLIETDHVSRWIAESRGHFGRIRSDRLYEDASVGDDLLDGLGNAVNHYVDEQSGFGRRLTIDHPRPAYFARCVIE